MDVFTSRSMDVHPFALRALRERSGYTVTRLAELAGTKQAHLSNIEAGRRNASPELIASLATALGVDQRAIVTNPKAVAA